MLLESLRIDLEHLHARTELSKIYQYQRKWKEAEELLLESLKIDPEQLHPRTEPEQDLPAAEEMERGGRHLI